MVPKPPSIGLFWIVNGNVVSKRERLEAVTANAGRKDVEADHYSTWFQLRPPRPDLTPVSYDYYPRGRVIYDEANKIFMVYADRCLLKRKSALKQITAVFGLSGARTEIQADAHYQCHRCNKNYLSD